MWYACKITWKQLVNWIFLEKIVLNLKGKIKFWKEVCQTQGWSGKNLNSLKKWHQLPIPLIPKLQNNHPWTLWWPHYLSLNFKSIYHFAKLYNFENIHSLKVFEWKWILNILIK